MIARNAIHLSHPSRTRHWRDEKKRNHLVITPASSALHLEVGGRPLKAEGEIQTYSSASSMVACIETQEVKVCGVEASNPGETSRLCRWRRAESKGQRTYPVVGRRCAKARGTSSLALANPGGKWRKEIPPFFLFFFSLRKLATVSPSPWTFPTRRMACIFHGSSDKIPSTDMINRPASHFRMAVLLWNLGGRYWTDFGEVEPRVRDANATGLCNYLI